MRKRIITIMTPISLLLMAASSAFAGGMQGKYKGRGDGDLSLEIRRNHLSMATGGPGHCMGSTEGIFTKDNDHIISMTEKNEFGSCSLTLYFDDKFRSVSVHENECPSFHGAGCGFDGVLTKKKSKH